MHPGERDLGRAGEEEAVLLELVDVRLLGREEARADHRLLAHEHGREHRHESGRGDVIEREAVERQREQRRVADDVAEPRAGEARGALELEAPDLARLLRLRERRRLAEAADLDGVVLGVAVRSRGVRRVRDERERLLAGRLGGGELLLRRPQLLLHPLQLLELLRRRLALQLRLAAELVDARHERPPALVGGEQLVERLGRALARERRPPGVGLGAGGLQVDHPRESR